LSPNQFPEVFLRRRTPPDFKMMMKGGGAAIPAQYQRSRSAQTAARRNCGSNMQFAFAAVAAGTHVVLERERFEVKRTCRFYRPQMATLRCSSKIFL
jgi:hypothetical protein